MAIVKAFMRDRESEIALEVEDFGKLKEPFRYVFGRDATVASSKFKNTPTEAKK